MLRKNHFQTLYVLPEMCSTSFNYQFYESNHLRGIEVPRNILNAAILILEAGFGFIVLHARYSHEGKGLFVIILSKYVTVKHLIGITLFNTSNCVI